MISNQKLLSEETVEMILRYQDIESFYRKSKYSGSVQKNMYIAYLKNRLPQKNIQQLIKEFEEFLQNYIKANPKEQSSSRYLIMPSFKDALDQKFLNL